jgi:hypothetical protein
MRRQTFIARQRAKGHMRFILVATFSNTSTNYGRAIYMYTGATFTYLYGTKFRIMARITALGAILV